MRKTLFNQVALNVVSLVQKCQLIEPLKYSNGAPPCIPILNDRTIPGLLTPRQLQGAEGGSDKRLRIFSGTANPVLAQVIVGSWGAYCLKYFCSCNIRALVIVWFLLLFLGLTGINMLFFNWNL